MADFREAGEKSPPPPSVSSPKKAILNRVNLLPPADDLYCNLPNFSFYKADVCLSNFVENMKEMKLLKAKTEDFCTHRRCIKCSWGTKGDSVSPPPVAGPYESPQECLWYLQKYKISKFQYRFSLKAKGSKKQN